MTKRVETAFKMNQVMNKVRDVDPNDSEAVKEALTSFFQNLSKNKEFSNNRWLRTLENVINRFPKYCGTHRATIENYLINYLDSNNYYNVIDAAKCAHVLQQVRAPQDKGATPKSSWRDQMSSLCDAALTLIDSAYNKTSNIYKHNKTQKESQEPTSRLQAVLKDIDSVTNTESTNKSEIICTRLRNMFVFIQAMLVEVYPVAKPIRPQLILEVILKALNSSGKEQSNKVTTIKVQALKTLDALVACLGSNLIPFSALVFRFIMQTLRWSAEHPSEESRKVRCTAYNSLTKWLQVLHTYRSIDNRSKWDEELTSHIVNDVTPRKHIIKLTASTTSMKNLSKKARKRLANTMLKESNISSHMPGEKNKIDMSEESNDEMAIAALECAETFLIVCGLYLKPVIHKQFQELLVRECYNIHSYKTERSIHLLRALEANRKCGGNVPPPTQYCLNLYSELVNSTENEISKFSSHALLDIRLHLHHSPPTLNFALEVPEARSNTNKKFASERNRAVLESLLGKERMPSEDLRDEVITIQDEPASKKPRTVIADNISLSSDSHSIQSNEVELIIEDIDEHCDQMSELSVEPVSIENDSTSEIDEHDAPTQLYTTSTINKDVAKMPEQSIIEKSSIDIDATCNELSKQSDKSIENGKENNATGTDNNATGINEKPVKNIYGAITFVKEVTRPLPDDYKESTQQRYTITLPDDDDDDIDKNPVSMNQSAINIDATNNELLKESDNSINNGDKESIIATVLENNATGTDNNVTGINEKPSIKKRKYSITLVSEITRPLPDVNIHEQITQLHVALRNDDDIDKSPVSMEVTYDYPATEKEIVKVLERTEDENLPSTNDTDDIQITCGQVLKSPENVKVNGEVTISPESNGNATENEKENSNVKKLNEDVSVEDMLADFVDEVNEDNATPA